MLRTEDVVLITEGGRENLTAMVPRTPAALEALVQTPERPRPRASRPAQSGDMLLTTSGRSFESGPTPQLPRAPIRTK